MALIGKRTKNVYKLGDEVKVIVDRVDIDAHEIYFKLYSEEEETEE